MYENEHRPNGHEASTDHDSGGVRLVLQVAAMESMNISLPEPLKQFVDGQIASGRYGSASEYVRELIREDEKRKAEERIEALLLEELQGEEAELTREDWSAIRNEARARLRQGKSESNAASLSACGGPAGSHRALRLFGGAG